MSGMPPTLSDAISTFDNDGNAAFVFKGELGGVGEALVTAGVTTGIHSTYTTTFQILLPQRSRSKGRPKRPPRRAKKAAKKAAKAVDHGDPGLPHPSPRSVSPRAAI